jgi:enterochelin esterase-like enzyme
MTTYRFLKNPGNRVRAARRVAGVALLLAATALAAPVTTSAAAAPTAATATAPTVTPADDVAFRTPDNPVIDRERFATFTYTSTTATKVTLNGSWGPSDATMMVTMSRGANGVFTAVLGPLEPGFYNYVINADGTDVQDPLNLNRVQSVPIMETFWVPGPSPVDDATRNVPHGKLTVLSYDSDVTGTRRNAAVWTPPGRRSTAGLPTLYLMHGGAGDYLNWIQLGKANDILDNLYARHRITPMVVVFPDGNVPGSTGLPEADTFPKEMTQNVVPAVEQAYRVSPRASDRALAGLSLGGLQVFNTLLAAPGAFPYLGDFSSGWFPATIDQLRTQDEALLTNPEVNRRTKLFRVYVGNKTDIAYANNVATRKLFDDYGIRYQFGGVYAAAGHVWETWQVNLTDFAPRLFH